LAHDFIPKGSRLKIRISFPRTLFSFEAMVECMWIRQLPYGDEFEVGVEFINLPSEVLDYLISLYKGVYAQQDAATGRLEGRVSA